MKRLSLLLFFISVFTCVIAQDFKYPPVNRPTTEMRYFTHEEIVPVSLSKNVLWINLKKWVSSNFESYRFVVDMEDKDTGLIILKWSSDIERPYSRYWTVRYEATCQVDVRENKYRIKIFNGSANIEPDIPDVDNMSSSSIKRAKEFIGNIISISEELGSSNRWKFDDNFYSVMGTNSNYEPIMDSLREGFISFNNQILNSLKTSMDDVDDF